ncbi:wax ester/triacylglycerol synthase domain-containing protein [Streptomyces sp. TRM 70351]|uniref:wax ester/triacylglycerol synthase domain-containing protein n=1 Tax=Streptomyces sp. TRM 70351 TaxID=3116552 RepID=UPI002E7B6E98|nr:wax ester/triacylglycerol synthase domain-containing protein [Streptomyces sp. TRM 70351]MEE1928891.1 wax ester/triacylglycerol synthase domain-containing protein [Streptomyces sp. TRM 70351]
MRTSTAQEPPRPSPERDQLSPKDRMVWRVETGGRARPLILAVLVLEGRWRWEDFLAWHDQLSVSMPRMRAKVAEGRGPLRPSFWQPDADFTLSRHLQRVTVGGQGTVKDVFSTAETLAEIPFQPGRSPWNGYLLDGVEGGRSAYVLKISHSIADGIRLRELFLRQSEAAPPAPPGGTAPPSPQGPQEDGPWAVVSPMGPDGAPQEDGHRRDTRSRPRQLAWAARFLGRAAADMLDLPHPVPPAGAHFSRHFFTTVVPLSAMKETAAASGGTVHDALVAAAMEGCHRYDEAHGVRRRHIRVFSPYGRPPWTAGHHPRRAGNHWFIVRFAVRTGLPDTSARIRAVRRAVRAAYHRDSADWMEGLARVCPVVPRRWFDAAFLRLCATHDFVVSNMPGPTTPLSVCGLRAEAVYAIAPTLGSAVTVTLVSYRGRCHVTVNVDPTVIADSEEIGRHICRALEEMTAESGRPHQPAGGHER